MPPETHLDYRRIATSENTAPCGSMHCTIHCPPGTSCGRSAGLRADTDTDILLRALEASYRFDVPREGQEIEGGERAEPELAARGQLRGVVEE